MDPTNSIEWTRKSLIGSVVSCRVGFQQNLSQISVMDPGCQHNLLGHQQQPQGHNKQESTTFILPTYGSNKQHCMDEEEFHWVCGVVQGWFSAKLGLKISDAYPSCQHNFCGHQQLWGATLVKWP
jgi:hypothetical protein